MFGIGMPELILILVIALLVFGPKKLPEISKALGKGMHELKKAGDDLKETWEAEVRAQGEEERRLKAAQQTGDSPESQPQPGKEISRSPAYPGEEIYGGPSLAYPNEEELLHPPKEEESEGAITSADSSDPDRLAYPSEEEMTKSAPTSTATGKEGSS